MKAWTVWTAELNTFIYACGQVYDATSFMGQIMEKAQKEIIRFILEMPYSSPIPLHPAYHGYKQQEDAEASSFVL